MAAGTRRSGGHGRADQTLLKLADCGDRVVELHKQLDACKKLKMSGAQQDAVVSALARAEFEKLRLEDQLRQLAEHRL